MDLSSARITNEIRDIISPCRGDITASMAILKADNDTQGAFTHTALLKNS